MEKIEYRELIPTAQKAVVCYLIENSKVLLISRDIVSNNLGLGLKAGVGGKLEPNESYDQSLEREVLEEVGVRVLNYENRGFIFFAHPHNSTKNMFVQVYVCMGWEGEPCVTEEGHVTPFWVDKENLPTNEMFPDNKFWVPQVLSGKTVMGYFTYNEQGVIIQRELEFRDNPDRDCP